MVLTYLRRQSESVELASYDGRLIAVAQGLGFTLTVLGGGARLR